MATKPLGKLDKDEILRSISDNPSVFFSEPPKEDKTDSKQKSVPWPNVIKNLKSMF